MTNFSAHCIHAASEVDGRARTTNTEWTRDKSEEKAVETVDFGTDPFVKKRKWFNYLKQISCWKLLTLVVLAFMRQVSSLVIRSNFNV